MKTGIVDVGGGLRGVYAAGVFDRCLDIGIHFDVCVGVSAGSANISSYIAGQKYTVAIVDAPADLGDTVIPSLGAGINVPVGGNNGVTAGVDPSAADKRVITVQPTNPNVDYILVTPEGIQVGAAQPGRPTTAP